MAYEVVSIGDGEMLYNAFQGVAMIFGSGNLEKIIKSGFIVGTLLISIRYLTNQEFPLHHVLVGVIVYSVMFIPTDTVTIEDMYTGDVRVVANVPIGVAVPMSVISTMGVNMTEMFETAFSTPSEASMLSGGGAGTGGYLNALNILIKLRNIGIGTTGSSVGWEGDIGKTINLYIENCVMFDLELADNYHEVTRESLEKSPDLWDAMKTTFRNIDIMTFLPSKPEGEQKSCKDAYVALNDYLNDTDTIDKTDRYVSGLLGITDAGQRADDKIDQAASALSLTGFDSQNFMRNALLASYLKDGPSAFILRTGQEQLNLQWASEQGMFNEIARPLMAFVEMFTVAISPIVAFLTTLGPIGMTMIVRYVQMMLWIALWGPLMAICNLYITLVTTRALKVMADNASANGSGMEAMIMHDDLYRTLETWLSAGGMLASSVPALSLMIVYGGSVAATNLAGKMTAGASSSVNPGRLMPEPVSMGASMQLGSMSEYSANVGAKKGGMADTSFSQSSMLNKSKQSANESSVSAINTVSKGVKSMNQSSQSSGSTNTQMDSLMSSITNTGTSGSGWSNTNSDTASNTFKAGSKETESIKVGASAAMNAGLDAHMVGVSAGAKVMADTGASAERGREVANAVTSVLGKMNYGGNATATASGSSSTNSNQTYSGTEEKSAQSKEFAEQVQAADTAMQKYQEISAMQDSWGKSASMPYQDLARRLSSSGAIADINVAKEGLKGKMSDSAYQQIAADAQHEINTSSAQDIMGYDREALSGFLMLNEADPVAAAEIMNNHLTPAANGSGVTMSPDSHKDLKKSPENIVSKDQAEGFRSKAHKGEVDPGDNNMGSGVEGSNEGGQANKESAPETATNNAKKEVDNDNDTGSGAEGSNGRGQSAKTATPQMATHSGHSPKAASGTKSSNSSLINKDSGGKSSKSGGQSTPTPKISWAKDPQESAAQPKGGHSSNVSQPVENAVNAKGVSDHAGIRDQIEKGGKLDGKFDGTAALNRSGGAVGDVVKKIAIDGFNEDVNLAKNVASDFVDIAKNSANSGVKFVDNIQNSIESGVKKLTGSNEPSDGAHKNKSDNDLPPTPKD